MRTLLVLSLLLTGITAAESVFNLGTDPARYQGVEAVVDTDATEGVAYKTTKGVAGVVHFAYSWETMGVFEATFRVKVADNTIPGPVVTLRYTCETARLTNLPPDIVSHRTLNGTDFATANAYQDVTVRWVTPEKGRNGWAVNVTGETEVWLDSVRARRIRDITETELLGYLPGAVPPPEPPPRTGPQRVHLVRGFFSDYYLLDLALPRLVGVRVDSSSWNAGGSAAGHPETPVELYGYDLLILAGTDIRYLGIEMRLAIERWVSAGGSLLMLGGPVSFGQAGLEKSVLGELLPVEVKGPFDLRREQTPMVATDPDHPIVRNWTPSPPMQALFRHDAAVRPGATIVLGTQERPVLVVGEHGRGRVGCLLTPPMGRAEPQQAGAVFWNHPAFPELMARTIQWLITRPAPDDPLNWQPNPASTPTAATILRKVDSGGLDDDGALVDLLGDDSDGDEPTVALTPTELDALIAGGGVAGVVPLLRAMGEQTDHAAIRRIEWAVRPFVGPRHAEQLETLSTSMITMVKESALALLGKANPELPPAKLAPYLTGDDERLRRAACRSILEGHLAGLRPALEQLRPALREEVYDLRDRRYEGYWFSGLRRDDPLFTYAEVTMTDLAMGRPGCLADAAELMHIMHVADLKIRSFIFLYNPKVPREAAAAERHRQRNVFLGPDLRQTIERFEHQLSTLPPTLHQEFRDVLLGTTDYERIIRLLPPAYALMAQHDTAEWNAFRPQLEAHALELARRSKRF